MKNPVRYVITDHALEQFIRRHAPTTPPAEARRVLQKLLETSGQRGKTALGQPIHVSGEHPEVRMVIKDRFVCVTVLPRESNVVDDTLEEEQGEGALTIERKREADIYADRLAEVRQHIASVSERVGACDRERAALSDEKSSLSSELQRLRNMEAALACLIERAGKS